MANSNHPRGAGLGQNANRRRPGVIDYGWVMEHGSRAQRREVKRLLRATKRAGNPDAAAALAEFGEGGE